MTTYEIEFHKVSSLPSNKDNYRGHVFFNDATNEPIIETTTDEEGNVVKRLQHERGIYLCAYDNKGNLDYIPYTVAGAGGDNIGMDVDTLNNRITLWASKLQNDIQKLAKLTVTPDQIMTQVEKFYNELNGEVANLRLKSDQIELNVKKYVDGVEKQYSQFTNTAYEINSAVVDLEKNLNSRISQTAEDISMEVSNKTSSASILAQLNGDESEVKIKADKIQLDGEAIANSLKLGGHATTDLFNQYKNTITGDLQTSIDELKTQIDNTIDNWYYEHYPVDWSDTSFNIASNNISYNTENNIARENVESVLKQSTTPKEDVEPYASWIKDGKDDRPAHVGDTFTNTNFQQEKNDVRDGRTWKFCATVDSDGNYTNYRWEPMSDNASAAMKSITDLENKVSNKRQVFIDTPTLPYEKGDLWVKMKSEDGKTSGENIFVCITQKSATETFSNTDWISTNDFIGKNILDAEIDKTKNELVKQIKDEVSEVDLRKVLEDGGFIESKNGTYVPASGLLSKSTDSNNVTTVTMQIGGGEPITWQTTPGVDTNGNEYLVVGTQWGDPAKSSFVVSKEGLLEAHNAIIYGNIFAGAGEIGGIKINKNSISSSNNNFAVTSEGELTAKNANIEGTIKATSLEIGPTVSIPQGNINGLTTDLNSAKSTADSAVTTATNAKSTADSAKSTATNALNTANTAKSNYDSLQNNLNDLQKQVSDYLAGNENISDWISNAFSQTVVNGGLMLSGNIFVADNNKNITAGMMGAAATDASKTPRFFAGNPTNSISSSNTNLGPDVIYGDATVPNYPFVVTADGRLYATNAELTGSLKINRRIGDEDKTFDIGDYVIGQMTGDGTFNMSGTVSGAIDSLNTEVYGPEMTPSEKFAFEMIQKDSADQIIEGSLLHQFIQTINAYRTRVSNSNTLLGRILRMEGKITALQNDITALQNDRTSGSPSTANKVTFSCSTCGARFIKNKTDKTNSNESNPDETYGDVKYITCSTCGSLAYKGLAAANDRGDSGNTGKNINDIETTVNRKPSLPAFKEAQNEAPEP